MLSAVDPDRYIQTKIHNKKSTALLLLTTAALLFFDRCVRALYFASAPLPQPPALAIYRLVHYAIAADATGVAAIIAVHKRTRAASLVICHM